MADGENPLIHDRDVGFLLYEVLDAPALCALPYFSDHSRETFDLYVDAVRRFSRDALFPSYRPMDEDDAYFEDGRVHTHPLMENLYPRMAELGVLNAGRPFEVEGQQLPLLVNNLALAYMMAGNLSAFGFCMLTSGAAHLIEAFGSDELKRTYMAPMYAGRWTGTMALTEPQAGSSLADVQTRATPTDAGHYLMQGNKVFISGGDQGFSENIVHLALGRIDGAPEGIRGVSLFVIPRLRPSADGDGDGALVPNDAHAAGTFHKLGWRGIPSIALNFGEAGDCHGYLVGEPHQGIRYMFQMMNEARIHVGTHGVATASVGYHEALRYARERPQGRAGGKAASPQVPIIEHADVRRMLLRQKAIVDGGLCLVAATARYQDLAAHAETPEARARAQALLDLMTPLAKSFPAERGFEANTLAMQVHGGYGYTAEYLPEALLRDQKLNSIHEGTTGIQGMDLLGRKVLKEGGRTLGILREEVAQSLAAAREAGVDSALVDALAAADAEVGALSARLCGLAAGGDPAGAMSHSTDFLEVMWIFAVGWQWLTMATAAQRGLDTGSGGGSTGGGGPDADFYRGKLQAARYWTATELTRIPQLARLCCGEGAGGDDSYAVMQDAWF